MYQEVEIKWDRGSTENLGANRKSRLHVMFTHSIKIFQIEKKKSPLFVID